MTQNPQGFDRTKTTLKLPTLTILAAGKMTKIQPAVAGDGAAEGANQYVDAKVRNDSHIFKTEHILARVLLYLTSLVVTKVLQHNLT